MKAKNWRERPGTAHADIALRTRQSLAILLTVAAGLAAVELWAMNSLYADQRMGGPALGAALACAFGAVPSLLEKAPSSWSMATIAALSAVIELVFCVALVSTVSAVAVLALPTPLTDRLLADEWTTDLVVLITLGLGMVVAARGWLKYSDQSRKAAYASIEAERARAKVAESEWELARSELSLLRAQIEPHFLWNTLAHIQHLTRKSPRDAEVMTGHLIHFLRAAVPTSRSDFSTLGAEIDSAASFLELMRFRMGERLSIAIELDPSISSAPFPPFLVQTLVENAIKHGVEPKVGPVSITVRAGLAEIGDESPDEQKILVEVIDSGVGLMAAAPTQGTGLGLRNVRERLQRLYPTGASLRIDGAPGGGVVASILTPMNQADALR